MQVICQSKVRPYPDYFLFAARFLIRLSCTGVTPMTFANVVKVTELVVDNSLDKLEAVNNKKKKIFEKFPATTYIPVSSLALPGMLFEIEAIAVRTEKNKE